MTNPVIPEAAVEAAARMIYQPQPIYDEAKEEFTGHRPWEWLTPEYQDSIRKDARKALEAAAPHMLSEAWQAGHSAGDGDCSVMWDADKAGESVKYRDIATPNPYRTAK